MLAQMTSKACLLPLLHLLTLPYVQGSVLGKEASTNMDKLQLNAQDGDLVDRYCEKETTDYGL